jgi:iron-sulfur cluster assembly protein
MIINSLKGRGKTMSEILTITEAASFQIKDMMKENEEEGSFLRVAVKGGGCSGLSYGMGFEQEPTDLDLQFEQHGLKVVVNKEDIPVLTGVKIDFKQSMMGGGFTIDNPNAIASCGCGSSFRTATNTGTPENC